MFLKKHLTAYMKMAETLADLSYAENLKVGCLLMSPDHQILGFGYNGTPPNWANTCETIETPDFIHSEIKKKTVKEVIHAESNTILKCARNGISTKNSIIFITHLPCIDCAKLIYQAGVSKIYYRHYYECNYSLPFLKKCGIEIEKI